MFVVPSFFGFQDAGKLDPDYLAFYARVTAAGGSLTTTEQVATNQLVLDLKGYGIWNLMKAIYPMVGASAAACAQNLKSSSFTGSFSSGWTFASTGVTPNGTSAYMNTGLTPSTSLSFNNASLSFYSRSNTPGSTGKSELCCNNQPSDLPLLQLAIRRSEGGADKFVSHIYSWATSAGAIIVSNTNSLGFYTSSRLSSTSHNIYKNSSNVGSSTSSYSSQPTVPLFLSAQNNNNSTVTSYSDRECAFASIGDGLTDTEASDFYSAVQAFQTTLNRQVS